MSHGLAVFKSNGALIFSSASVTWNQVDMLFVAGGGSVNNNYSILAGRETLAVQVLIDPPAITHASIAHTISISGTNVSVSGGSVNAYIIILMR